MIYLQHIIVISPCPSLYYERILIFLPVFCLLLMESHHIYVTSTADGEIYPNTSTSFTNNIQTLTLDKDLEYEVGLLNVLLPRQYYIAKPGERDCCVHLEYGIKPTPQSTSIERHTLSRSIDVNILSNDIGYLVLCVNNMITTLLKEIFDGDKHHLLSYFKEVLAVTPTNDHLSLLCYNGFHPRIVFIKVSFDERLAQVLGFVPNIDYDLFSSLVVHEEPEPPSLVPQLGHAPMMKNGDVQCVLIYTDLVNASRYAGKNINILDVFSLSGGLTKGMHPTIYKPLKSKVIDSISIKLTDQKGRPMYFEEGYPVICLLHIRSR